MLEVEAHQQLKHLLRGEAGHWEHQLTLSRLVGRSLRRQDRTRIQLSAGSCERWWLALLVPLSLRSRHTVLVLDESQQQRLLQIERPRLLQSGLKLGCWTGFEPPPADQIWLLTPEQLLEVHHSGQLRPEDHLVIPEAEWLPSRLRRAMTVQIDTCHWEQLRAAFPSAGEGLLDLHERLSRQLVALGGGANRDLVMPESALTMVRDLLQLLGSTPEPWCQLMSMEQSSWASWARMDPLTLQWCWQLQPLEPVIALESVFSSHPWTLIHADGGCRRHGEARSADDDELRIDLRDAPRGDPLPIYLPRRQPLPNTEIFADHLLEQSRRLILGRSGLTAVLVNPLRMRQRLCSELAAEFGSRVTMESTAPETNGVICCSWSWWLSHQHLLPEPEQLIAAMLPIASREDPLTAARVESLKRQGRDWFRTLLLPEALAILIPAIASLRQSGGRLAILDGRVRGRSWGEHVLRALEPWEALQRLRPD